MAEIDSSERPSAPNPLPPVSPPAQASALLAVDKSPDHNASPIAGATLTSQTASATSASASSSATAQVPPKRFSSVNVNKSFLQKSTLATPTNSTVSTAVHPAAQAKATVRPATQHSSPVSSRLITTKLTGANAIGLASPGGSSGASWLRPSPSSSPANVTPPPSSSQTTLGGKSLLNSADRSGATTPNGALGKPKAAWAPVTASGRRGPDSRIQSDFPTAAEVAQTEVEGRNAKLLSAQIAAEAAAAQKQAMNLTADTFRGVHLDPNAHHWDEMEDEDNDFLGGVLDFGDGKSYTIARPKSPPKSPPKTSEPALEKASVSVRRGERLPDDYDRSWPRSPSTAPHRDLHPAKPPRPSGSSSRFSQAGASNAATMLSPATDSRVLFNERSNRLEPYESSANGRSPRTTVSGLPPNGVDRGPPRQFSDALKEGFSKPGAPRGFGPESDRGRAPSYPRSQPNQTGMPPPPRPTGRDQSQDQSRRELGSLRSSSYQQGESSRRQPSFAGSASSRDQARDSVRQLPPHLSQAPMSPSALSSSSRTMRDPYLSPSSSAHPSLHSPTLSTRSLAPDTVAPPTPQVPARMFDEETTKSAMHDAAERARKRRQEEEAERERQRERALKKAAELEERMKQAASEKAARETAAKEQAEKEEAEKAAAEALAEQRESERVAAAAKLKAEQQAEAERVAKDDARRERERDHTPKDAELARPRGSEQPRRDPPVSRLSENLPPRPTFPPRQASNRGLFSPGGPSRPLPSSSTSDSWRSKAPSANSSAQPTPNALSAPPPIALMEDNLTVLPGEELEVFDFSEIGKMVGEESQPEPDSPAEDVNSVPQTPPSKAYPRPVASDFFSPSPPAPREPPPPSKSDVSSWRRPLADREPLAPAPGPWRPRDPEDLPKGFVPTAPSPRREPTAALPSHSPTATPSKRLHDNAIPSRSPRLLGDQVKPYREAPMSTIDDAMFRFKAAMLQSQGSSSESSKDQSSRPSELHNATTRLQASPSWRESLLSRRLTPVQRDSPWNVTSLELPHSPPPAWSNFTVALPHHSSFVHRGPLSKKQTRDIRQPPAIRWDILSWDPPVKDMSKKTLSLEELLFKKIMVKGVLQYRVALPRHRLVNARVLANGDSPNPFSRSPSRPIPLGTGLTFKGRDSTASSSLWPSRRGADELSWRKPAGNSAQTTADSTPAQPFGGILNTTSRSPPPEPPTPASVGAFYGRSKLSVSPRSESPATSQSSQSRLRSQPKMPNGTDVAFYKSMADGLDPGVSFTVSSEIDSSPSNPSSLERTDGSSLYTSDNQSVGKSPQELVSDFATLSAATLNLEQRNFRSQLVTPPPSSIGNAWGKSPLSFPIIDSPSRSAPDTEHLKAVWSHGSEKDATVTGNSLKDIADDFPTAIPLSVQDMKSEDGDTQKETPPPTSAVASLTATRMSVHDAHRAFQQVPPSPKQPAGQTMQLPGQQQQQQLQLHAPRPASFPTQIMHLQRGHPVPLAGPNMRPYSGASPYPPPPSNRPGTQPGVQPGVIYAQPYPMPPGNAQMRGAWYSVPLQQPQVGSFVRTAPPTPYMPQMVQYAAPPHAQPAMYPSMPPPPAASQQPQPPKPLVNGHLAPRGRGMAVISPVMTHAHPTMYNPSPGDHSMPMTLAPQHYQMAGAQPIYAMPVGAGRGMVQQMPGQHPHPPQPGMYPVVGQQPFTRQW